MKRGIITLVLLIMLISPMILAESIIIDADEMASNTSTSLDTTPKPTTNAWNETIIISDTWQQLIGTFFGLNLRDVSTEISVREALVFFSIYVMFLIIFLDILKLTPFFKGEFGPISGEFIASIIITTLVSISGALIGLKNLFVQIVAYILQKLDFDFVNTALRETTFSTILTTILVIISFTVIVLFFNMINPLLKKYSKISRAEAKGRMLNRVIEKSDAESDI